MDWSEQDPSNCSVGRTAEIVGRPWVLVVLREVFRGLRRFDQMQRHLDVSAAVLSRRLDSLVAAGLLVRQPYQAPGQRERHEYHLTAAGRELFPILAALHEWGDAHLADEAGPATNYHHRDCGGTVRLTLTCTEGHTLATTGEDVTVTPGPGAKPLTATA
ncbi:helix-turn-helix transcriptional regulator [Nocardia yamanashiensis]|uniref:winged helix-turn-helix transcriptional regulator n=1 Tax=Nocardia yamanashiensis TaxID=209247 RepID=UPI001E59CFE7|nr:helix-turn-helix domain-containing protein [Nocardia yamanashiensis]UGT43326.1 helix-turn-helix transcriptional regulator [Nocardia yamanashiensis]